ncbi:hypothetical protein FA15DRAFT_755787 [Coprinopsis marcescibilis]|uniref:Zn(2)-C6 fungal-type domain-containing protein n=1 Tax=Coprinopsis marcescibilis TaxID=230819 RepID=A0A5C3KZD0_COPMA|nr:hypothetical protein FA15DRAFT_755787 [Coprinopsis marcescibilis]
MEDTFQFIIESPQHTTGHKKRPRLVTSCDNCRLKKIKCLQPTPEAKCEACKAAKIPCRFKDRERYFAERSRAIAGPSVTAAYNTDHRHDSGHGLDAFSVPSGSSSPSLTNSNPRSNSHSPKASGLVSPESEPNGRYPYSSDPRRADGYSRHSAHSSISSFHSRNNSYGYNNYVGSPSPVLQQPHNQRLPSQPDYRQVNLFDPERSQYPHHTLMPHFIQLFFEQHGPEYTFITYDQVIHDFWENRLSPVVANCIASMACKYSNIPELAVRGLHTVAETYAEIAKNLVASQMHMPSMDTLHAVMLICWIEYKHSKFTSFRQFCSKAISMAQDLGLSDNDRMGHASDSEQRRRQATWTGILQLHLTASQTVTSRT